MSYVVKLTPKAHRQYKKLPENVQQDLLASLDNLVDTPEQYPFLAGKFSNLRKFTFHSEGNPYRAVFTIADDSVLIAFLGTREGFYQELEQYFSE